MIKSLKLTVIIAACYYFVAKLSLLLVFVQGAASPVWPAAGVALAFVMVYGKRAGYGIFLGCLLMDLEVSFRAIGYLNFFSAIALSAGVSFGSTLQALLGGFLVKKLMKSSEMMRPIDSSKFVLLTLLSCLLGSSMGVVLRFFGQIITAKDLLPNWISWWVGDVIGVFLFTPLCLAWFSKRVLWKKRRFVLTIVLPIAFMITFGVFMYAQHMQKQELVKKMNVEIEAFTGALESRMDEFYLALNSMAGFYGSSDFVSREEFSVFGGHLIKRLPHLRSLAWVPKVSGDQRNEFVESVRKECCKEYKIKELNDQGEFVESPHKKIYFPILYIEPFEKNRVALGIDNNAEQNRREASEMASDSNIMTMSAAIVLGQDQTSQIKSILVIYPIYQKNKLLDTFENRRANLLGYVTATIRIGDLIESAFRESSEMAGIHFHIFDVTTDDVTLLYSKSSKKEKLTDEFKKSVKLNLGGRSWKIIFAPTQDYRAGFQPWTLWYLMGGALLLSSMLMSVLLLLTGQNENTLRVVKRRTRELTKTRQELSDHNLEMEKLVFDLKEQKNNLEDQRSAMISLMEDLEDQRNQIKEQAKKLEKASQAKSEFLATMSHEIRTPMNAILGMAELLEEGSMDEDKKKYLQTLRRAGESLMELINDILDLSKIESGMLTLENIPVDLVELVDDVERLFTTRIKTKALEFKIHIAADVPRYVISDPIRLKQIFINLIGNSIKFTEKGSVVLQVDLSKKVHQGLPSNQKDITFKVKDTGIGIAEHRIASLFEPFTQADSSMTRKYGGTGLGLSICKRIVELMHGEMHVESRVGEGSTFAFTIPMLLNMEGKEIDSQKEQKEIRVISESLVEESNDAFASVIEPIKVLLVEDSPDNRMLVTAFLKKAPVMIDVAVHGEEAIQKVFEKQYDVIYMDMQMPIMDGYTATQKIREWEKKSANKGAKNVIYALTANALKEDAQKCIDAGCDFYLSKPLKKATLLETIRKIIEKKA